MTTILQNDWLQFELEPGSGRWGLQPASGRWPRLEGAQTVIEIIHPSGNRLDHLRLEGDGSVQAGNDEVLGHPCSVTSLVAPMDSIPVVLTLDVAVLQDMPWLLWRLSIENKGPQGIELGSFRMLEAGGLRRTSAFRPIKETFVPAVGGLEMPGPFEKIRCFVNGWQSWSFTGSLGIDERQPRTRLGPLSTPIFVNPRTGVPDQPGRFASDMFGIVLQPVGKAGLLAGWISQLETFGSVDFDLQNRGVGLSVRGHGDRAEIEPGSAFHSDWACLGLVDLDRPGPLDEYLELSARAAGARVPDHAPAGWSSWYYYFETVSGKSIRSNLEWIAENRDLVPLELVQIDDGFEANVGDWLTVRESFDGRPGELSRATRSAGLRPGLWLAPYIAKPRAEWARRHPDWILRNRNGRAVNAGYNWSTFTVGFDPTHPGVEDGVQNLVRKAVEEWGFEFLKLDFLYAAALPGLRYDRTQTRAQAMRKALRTIRQAAGDETWLLGCGCPLGSGIGLVDSMRVAPDVAPRWSPAYQGIELFFRREPGLPAVRNAIQGGIGRMALNRWWWINDPDCLLVRSRDTHLNEHEVQTLITVAALTAGALIDSDDLPSLVQERVDWLAKLFPPLPQSATVLDWWQSHPPASLRLDLQGVLGQWTLAAFVNWSGQPSDIQISRAALGLPPVDALHVVDFWQNEYLRWEAETLTRRVPAHGVAVLALRNEQVSTPTWLGDTLHFSQGLEVKTWQWGDSSARATLDLGHKASGSIWLRLPGTRIHPMVDGVPAVWGGVGGGVFRIDVEAEASSEISIGWDAPAPDG